MIEREVIASVLKLLTRAQNKKKGVEEYKKRRTSETIWCAIHNYWKTFQASLRTPLFLFAFPARLKKSYCINEVQIDGHRTEIRQLTFFLFYFTRI